MYEAGSNGYGCVYTKPSSHFRGFCLFRCHIILFYLVFWQRLQLQWFIEYENKIYAFVYHQTFQAGVAMLDINNDEKTLSPLASFHPEMAYCHSERSEESPANQGNKRFFVAFAPQNDTRELGFRKDTS